jgi:hypothetical protein
MTKIRSLILALLLALVSLLPVGAQINTTNYHTISFDGVTFTFDKALGSQVAVQQFAGDPLDVEQPGGAEAPHTEFIIHSEYNTLPIGFVAPISVRVYEVPELADYEFPNGELLALQNLLDTQPDLADFMTVDATDASIITLPYLPVYPAGQVIRARAEYLENDSVRGVRYLTIYRQDVSPFLGSEFLYTFQGLSKDGSKYISIVAHLNTTLFPAEMETIEPQSFMENFGLYLTDSVTLLNEAQPTDFTPDLTQLDALVRFLYMAPRPD